MGTERTYEMREPITDLLLAVHLLTEGWNDRTARFLVSEGRVPVRNECVIHVQHWGGGYGKCEYTGQECYLVDRSIVDELRELGTLQELTAAQIRPDMYALDGVYRFLRGTAFDLKLKDVLRERSAKAQERIVPLLHTEWATTTIESAGHEWDYPFETWANEKVRDYFLTFHFKTAHGENITVREDTGEVTSTYRPKKSA